MTLVAKRRSEYGSRPWGIYNTESSKWVEVERRSADTGKFAGYVAFFARKADAQRTINALVTQAEAEN